LAVWNVIIPTDELIFFRGVGIPPTSFVFLKQGGRDTPGFYPHIIVVHDGLQNDLWGYFMRYKYQLPSKQLDKQFSTNTCTNECVAVNGGYISQLK